MHGSSRCLNETARCSSAAAWVEESSDLLGVLRTVCGDHVLVLATSFSTVEMNGCAIHSRVGGSRWQSWEDQIEPGRWLGTYEVQGVFLPALSNTVLFGGASYSKSRGGQDVLWVWQKIGRRKICTDNLLMHRPRRRRSMKRSQDCPSKYGVRSIVPKIGSKKERIESQLSAASGENHGECAGSDL